MPALGAALALEGWGLVQPNLRSSYCQFGFRRLDDDVVDLRALLRHLAAEPALQRVRKSTRAARALSEEE